MNEGLTGLDELLPSPPYGATGFAGLAGFAGATGFAAVTGVTAVS